MARVSKLDKEWKNRGRVNGWRETKRTTGCTEAETETINWLLAFKDRVGN